MAGGTSQGRGRVCRMDCICLATTGKIHAAHHEIRLGGGAEGPIGDPSLTSALADAFTRWIAF